MGAYENPITVVDTESAKYWAQAFTNLSNSVVKSMENRKSALAASNKEQAEQDQFTLKYAMKQRDDLYKRLAEANVTNPSKLKAIDNLLKDNLKYWKMAQYGSDTATKTYGLDQQGKVQKLLSQIIPLTKGIRETENSFFEKYQPGNLGNQGNIVYNKDKQHLNMQKIFSLKKGINPGKENWSYDSENLDAGFNINFTGPRFKEGGLNIDPITLANYTFTEIPLGNVQFANILKPHSKDNLDGLNITNNNGDINAEYLDWTKTTTIPSEDGSVNIITTPPQFAKIAGVVNTKLETNAMAILKDEELANAWCQNILIKNNPKGKPLPMAENGEGLFSREGTEKFVKAYKQYIGTQIPEGRYIDLNSVDGKAFLETEQGQNVIERLKLKYDEDTQKWIQQGVDIDVYEGDDPIEGIVYIDELTGKTKTTGSTGTDKKPNKNIKYIDDLEINLVSQIGPGDSKGRKLIDLNNLEMELSKPPLNIIVKKAENVGGREARTITKTRDGQDYSATIYDNSTVEEIRAQLKYLETGENYKPEKKNPNEVFNPLLID